MTGAIAAPIPAPVAAERMHDISRPPEARIPTRVDVKIAFIIATSCELSRRHLLTAIKGTEVSKAAAYPAGGIVAVIREVSGIF